MIPNKIDIKCPQCGRRALLEVFADDFEDTPKSFSIRITCSGNCETQYVGQLTPKKMQEMTGRPLSGWAEDVR